MTFTGWIEKILPANDYEQKVVVTNYRNETAKKLMIEQKEFPNSLCFSFGVKNGANAQLDNVKEGDKVEVKFFLSGNSGISKTSGKYYAVNNLRCAKKDGITLIERATVSPDGQPRVVSDIDPEDIPF